MTGFPKIQKKTFEVITIDEFGKENSRTTKEAEFYREDLGNSIFLDMVRIPGGEFMMGFSEGEGLNYEKPQHNVKVPSFWMGEYPVTQSQWQEIMGNNPSEFKDSSKNPVERISWNDAQKFCQQLSQKTGNKYRLPSEAEWEYACRAGTNTSFHFGETITTDITNYRGTDWENHGEVYPGDYGKSLKGIFRKKTTPVEHFQIANNFGLCDFHGNVWEWCEDDWHENYKGAPNDGSAWIKRKRGYKVIRGGCWNNYPTYCLSATRQYFDPEDGYNCIGFRIVCAIPRT